MAETIVVGLIVVVALAFTARLLYRSLTGKTPGCSCGQPGVCPLDDAAQKAQCDSGTDEAPPSRPCDNPD